MGIEQKDENVADEIDKNRESVGLNVASAQIVEIERKREDEFEAESPKSAPFFKEPSNEILDENEAQNDEKEEDVNMNEMVQTEQNENNEQHQMNVENTESAQKDKAVNVEESSNDNIAPLDVNEDNNEDDAENDVDVSLQNKANENVEERTEIVN